MDAYSRRREVEKPKTITERRRLLVRSLVEAQIRLEGQAMAAEQVLGQTPVASWLRNAARLLMVACQELDRGKR